MSIALKYPALLEWKLFWRSIIAWLFYYSGLFALYLWWDRRTGRNLIILNFHRILPADSPVLQKHLALRSLIVKQSNFEMLLQFLKKHFCICSLAEFAQFTRQERGVTKLYCILTFDDGYADFMHYAWPVLQSQKIPVTMFLPTALIGTAHAFWWDRLYHRCMHLERLGRNEKFNGATPLLQQLVKVPVPKRAPLIYQLIEFFQSWPLAKVQALLDDLENGQRGDEKNVLMNWDEVETLRKSGVHFGSHTRHHLNLAAISQESLQEEVALSRQDLETRLHETIDTFSFPGGHFSPEALEAVVKAGYAHACSMRKGINRPEKETRFCLKRTNVWDGTLQNFRGHFSPAMFAFNLIRADFASRFHTLIE